MSDLVSLYNEKPVISTTSVHINKITDVVWVNGPTHLLGRFGRFLYEINDPTFGARVYCVQAVRGIDSWNMFKEFMLEVHNISVGDEFMPKFLKG